MAAPPLAVAAAVDDSDDNSPDAPPPRPPSHYVLSDAVAIDRHFDAKQRREVGGSAVWSLSSAKPGYGVQQLRDNDLETYWQSDGNQPHLVNIQFPKKLWLDEVMLYLDYPVDESYAPSLLSIRAGSSFHDLRELKEIELDEPHGWVVIPLRAIAPPASAAASSAAASSASGSAPLKTNFLQIAILSNHQHGRDSHIRQAKVFSPLDQYTPVPGLPVLSSKSAMFEFAGVR